MDEDLYVPKSKFIPKNKFSKEEDTILKQAVQIHGENDWDNLRKMLPGRTARQCRERWENYVNPELNLRPFTAEEDNLLLSVYNRLGPRWKLIATHFKGRSVNNVKNRYHLLKKHQNTGKIISNPVEEEQVQKKQTVVQVQETEKTVSENIINSILKFDFDTFNLFAT